MSVVQLTTSRRGDAHDSARMRTVRDLTECLPRLSVINEDLRVRAHTSELIAGRCVAHVLDELRVRLDALPQFVQCSRRTSRSVWCVPFRTCTGPLGGAVRWLPNTHRAEDHSP